MFAMTFQYDLNVSGLNCSDDKIGKGRLNCGMKVNFWLLQDNSRAFVGVIQKDERWQYLRNAKSYISDQGFG